MQRAEPAGSPRHDLRAMLGDAFFFSVMVGMGETYLPAFVLAVSAGRAQVASGLISSIPPLVGALLQLLSPAAVRRFGSHRRWIVLCATVQAASFIPLCVGALVGQIPIAAVFVIAALYWGFGMGSGPAWNTWVETIVPKTVRTPFFALRTRFSHAGVLVGFALGGCALHFAKLHDRTHPDSHWLLWTFAALFATSATCRVISARFISAQSEPQPVANGHRRVSVREIITRARNGGSERLLLYFAAVQFTVYIAGPYFNPYMLGQMHLADSYVTYMLLISTCFVGKIVALPALGSVAQRWGARRLLWIGGVGIVPLSAMWLVSNSIPFLMAIQIAGGIAWAAYELATFLLFFETIRRDERTSVLTVFNVANALAMVLGSLCGGLVLRLLGEHREVYLFIFGLSSLGRLSTLVLLYHIPELHFQPVTAIGMRTLGVNLAAGSIERPILASLPEESSAAAIILHDAEHESDELEPVHLRRAELTSPVPVRELAGKGASR